MEVRIRLQKAGKIANKIREAFNRVEVQISYSQAPDDVERANVIFQPYYSFSGGKERR